MRLFGQEQRTIEWLPKGCVRVIDQRLLPHSLEWVDLYTVEDTYRAIRDMIVRGAPLIGATAAYGLVLAAAAQHTQCSIWDTVEAAYTRLKDARPTAVNLKWALDRCMQAIEGLAAEEVYVRLFREAKAILEEDVAVCSAIGDAGFEIIQTLHNANPNRPVRILTHCNAGWLACVDWGTATAPIYKAFNAGIPIEVWVDETRPRLQGANLTAFELMQHGVPCTLITDNAGGHYMQQGLVDMVIVGTDRVTRNGDVCNKIGTYLKALAAQDNQIPFYVALPSSTLDMQLASGADIEIEERQSSEVNTVVGWNGKAVVEVRISPENCKVGNPGFDVTPARLVTALITERGCCSASEEGILGLFPEKAVGV